MSVVVKRSARARPFTRILRVAPPNFADAIVFLLIAGGIVIVLRGAHEAAQPLAALRVTPITLDPAKLLGYALRTTLRMFAALAASTVFTLVVATLAARSRCSAAVGSCAGTDIAAEAATLAVFVVAGNTLLRPLMNAIASTLCDI